MQRLDTGYEQLPTRTARSCSSTVVRLALRAGLYALVIGPIAVLALYAGSSGWFFPEVLPASWSFDPIARQLASPRTREALATSLGVAGAVTLLALLIGLPAARTLGLRRFRGRSLALLLLLLPNLVPLIATGMGLNILFLHLGLAGNALGVILVHLVSALPYAILALLGVFARYDEGYEQQALTLGANPLRVFWHVMLPLAGPGIVVAALFAFLVSWSQYVLTLLIGGGRVITLPMLLFAAVSGGNPATIAALALIFAVPPLVALALTAHALVEGTAPVGQHV
jgi:putative spermidine/putrescine transport system permease protein